MSSKVRVWDLPTRIFHWALVAFVVASAITGYIGGSVMVWHFRSGYAVFSLLLFRILWGLVGGRWSRFASFIYSPTSLINYLRGQGRPEHSVGHSPLGAGSVFALLGFLSAQVATGLFSDDEIAFAGPLTRFVSNATVSQATSYHKQIGQWVLIALVLLHVLAILFYLWKKKNNLIKPMILGDKLLATPVPSSRDDTWSRVAAAVLFGLCAALVAWLVALGG
ncbi:MAG: cytochrome b/b6 domain-containing protein [Burkholderiaceae bacterium]